MALSARTFQTATNYKGELSAAAYAMANTGGWWTNKRMPDAVSDIQQAILYRKGRSMMGGAGAMRTAVCPHWNEVSIDDIYSDSASGTRHFTIHVLLGDVILVQPPPTLKSLSRWHSPAAGMSPVYPIFEAGELEIRQSGRSRTLRGRFNYGSMATVRDRGRVRKERFEPRAFRFAIEDDSRQLDVLVGHDFGSRSRRGRPEHSRSATATMLSSLKPSCPTIRRAG